MTLPCPRTAAAERARRARRRRARREIVAPVPVQLDTVLSWMLDEGRISDADAEDARAIGDAIGRLLREIAGRSPRR